MKTLDPGLGRALPRWVGVAVAVAAALGGRPAWADEDFAGGSVVFARGPGLFRIDASGRNEVQLAELPAKASVRALRSDAAGRVLLVDLAGTWGWLPLDGSARALVDLPCADGPAQLAEDGSRVLCRSAAAASRSIVIELVHRPGQPAQSGKPIELAVPTAGARLAGAGAERMLVWTDGTGVWTAPEGDTKSRTRVADAPLRGFLASPDGERAIGVFADQVYSDVKHTGPADVLMTLQLDGGGARRKAIRDGVAVEWSHDSQWVLVQDGNSACIMRVSGGQYKCWPGFVAQSVSSDGRWGLALGNRDGSRRKPDRADKADKAQAGKSKAAAKPSKPAKQQPPQPPAPISPDDKPWDHIDEPANEPESAVTAPPAAAGPDDDVSVAPPNGQLALYRLRLEGAFTDKPALLVKVVDGAAVWVPKAP